MITEKESKNNNLFFEEFQLTGEKFNLFLVWGKRKVTGWVTLGCHVFFGGVDGGDEHSSQAYTHRIKFFICIIVNTLSSV